MAFDPVVLTKNGHQRVAKTPSTLVQLQWDGWRPVDGGEQVDVVQHVDSSDYDEDGQDGYPADSGSPA